MGTPANPTDGQKITFQVTQGTGAPFTLSWSSGYEFAAGLPQPTLSTTAAQIDLLGFIYNPNKGKWLLVAVVTGFASRSGSQGPAAGHLPAVRFHERAIQPGFLFRAVFVRSAAVIPTVPGS
jgi:hypothetical protein